MHRLLLRLAPLLPLALSLLIAPPAQAQGVVNIYSARHYQTDEAFYANFTKETGIRINRLDGREDELVERIRNEGASSPADVLITVDASRLELADKMGLFQPVQSKALEARIPAHLRTPNWLAFSTRARVIVYNKAAINPAWVQTYADLAAPRLKTQICVRSGMHPYNLSLGAALIATMARPRRKPGPAASSPISRGRPRAATPTSCAPSPPASAASPSPTATTSPG
jgi:iron(III) transport system substrate-binding protein